MRAFVVLIAGLAWAAPAFRQELNLRVPMRDGVHLATNIFRPAALGRVPAILFRTPYGKPKELTPFFRGFVEHGYALVLQDVRGRYGSEGTFDPLRHETADSDDTLNWIARQPWSNARVGMIGGSYVGIVQWRAALANNPHLKAIFPAVSGCDEYYDRYYSPGGAMRIGQRLLWMQQNLHAPGAVLDLKKYIWHLPLRSADAAATGRTIGFYQQTLNHPSYDAWWTAQSTCAGLEQIHVPVFSTGGWYDNFVESDLEAFHTLRDLGGTVRTVIGPWAHNMSYDFPGFSFGPDAKPPLRRFQLVWLDHFVRDGLLPDAALTQPGLEIFVMGINRWRKEREWPLSRAHPTPFYLSSRGRANTLSGDGQLTRRPASGDEEVDRYIYDPRKPVPTVGGAICCDPKVLPPGPLDQRWVERRSDVLVYTSEALAHEMEVTGPIRVVLYVSTSAPDTDFTGKLVDVAPDGYARILTDGILRLRYRESAARPLAARPGEVYPIVIDAGVTSNVFLKGHRIRLEISSSNFPRFDRNMNTGRPAADDKELRKASQTVWHDASRPSHVVLPVVPGA